MERDKEVSAAVKGFYNFNSHAHVERDKRLDACVAYEHHFNSHAHVERDLKMNGFNVNMSKISTHTLTWSVT